MLKRGIIFLALVATVALPFILRPHQETAEQADDTLVLISPHNEAIRHEFTLGFRDWYKARTGRTVFLDWRNVGGTSDIARYLEGEYVASFRSLWTGKLGRAWSADVQSGFRTAG
jgi:iron(III) transport system substrate-binding protein